MNLLKKLCLIAIGFGALTAQAMEISGIKDANGQILNPSIPEQRALYHQCKMLKHGLKDANSFDHPDFNTENMPSFVTKKNLAYLAKIINNPKLIEQESCSNIVFELFKLADYLQAPEQILSPLAFHAYNHASSSKRLLLENNIQAGYQPTTKLLMQRSELDAIKKLARFQMPYYPNFSVFMEDYSADKVHKLLECYENSCELNLTPEALKKELGCAKRIANLDGIQALRNTAWARLITHISASNQCIDSISLEQLHTTFPALCDFNLSGNEIKKLTRKNLQGLPAEFNLDLSKNQIAKIEESCIANPSSLKNVKINLKNNPLAHLDNNVFDKSIIERTKAWLKSFRAKGNALAHSFVSHKLICVTGMAAIAALPMCIEITKGSLPKLMNMARNRDFFTFAEKLIALGSVITATGVLGTASYLEWILQSNYNLSRLSNNDPYRIKIETSSQSPVEFPSNYTYRLFRR
jgi:Leucine-rich repeat (LRR) protein